MSTEKSGHFAYIDALHGITTPSVAAVRVSQAVATERESFGDFLAIGQRDALDCHGLPLLLDHSTAGESMYFGVAAAATASVSSLCYELIEKTGIALRKRVKNRLGSGHTTADRFFRPYQKAS